MDEKQKEESLEINNLFLFFPRKTTLNNRIIEFREKYFVTLHSYEILSYHSQSYSLVVQRYS